MKGESTMDELLGLIRNAIATAQSLPKGREASLVVTKLQEAEHWHRAGLGLWDAVPEEPQVVDAPDNGAELPVEDALEDTASEEESEPGPVSLPEAEPHPLTKPKKRPVER